MLVTVSWWQLTYSKESNKPCSRVVFIDEQPGYYTTFKLSEIPIFSRLFHKQIETHGFQADSGADR